MMNTIAVVLARGGSKGIHGKNIKSFCGTPLIVWTLEQLVNSGAVGSNSIYVSSDDDQILDLAAESGVQTIKRPDGISGDESTSESGWIHAINLIESHGKKVDLVIAPQVTSPVREPSDFSRAVDEFVAGNWDSMFSATYAVGLYMWTKLYDGSLRCEGYDYTNPHRRRQDMHGVRYIENGSFYLFTPDTIRASGTRFGRKVGAFDMPRWKSFEIDDLGDFEFCELIAKHYLKEQFVGALEFGNSTMDEWYNRINKKG